MEKSPFRILGLETSFGNERAFFHGSTLKSKTSNSQQEILSMNYDSEMLEEKRVEVRLGDLVPLLIDAAESNRMWLRDFNNDIISVPRDLYEVVLAYRSLNKAA